MKNDIQFYFQKVKKIAGIEDVTFKYPQGEAALDEMFRVFGEDFVDKIIEDIGPTISKAIAKKAPVNGWGRFNYAISSIKNKIVQEYIADLMRSEAKTYNHGDVYEVNNVKQQSRSDISKWLDEEDEC